jgi:hypothetical protein
LLHFMIIWNILWPFGIIYGSLVWFVVIRYIFPILVLLDREKSCNPGFNHSVKDCRCMQMWLAIKILRFDTCLDIFLRFCRSWMFGRHFQIICNKGVTKFPCHNDPIKKIDLHEQIKTSYCLKVLKLDSSGLQVFSERWRLAGQLNYGKNISTV